MKKIKGINVWVIVLVTIWSISIFSLLISKYVVVDFLSDFSAITLIIAIISLLVFIVYIVIKAIRFIFSLFFTKKKKKKKEETKKPEYYLSHTCHKVIDVKKWHDVKGRSHIEFWVTLNDGKERSYKFENSSINVRKGHEVVVLYNYYNSFLIYNKHTSSIHKIANVANSKNNNSLSIIIKLLLFVFCFSGLFFYGVLGLIATLLISYFISNYINEKMAYNRLFPHIRLYLEKHKIY